MEASHPGILRSSRLLPVHWILWVLVCTAPLLAYASPLWNNLLADTPIADLVWIPVISILWMMWNLYHLGSAGPDDAETNAIVGAFLAVIVGGALTLAPGRWPGFFVFNHGGLLLWPFWILAMTWIFWGLSATRRIIIPLVYLLLVWPPIFESLANATQSVLVKWAITVLVALSTTVSWLKPANVVGTFSVLYHQEPVLVVVAQACSGADSLLGSAIIIPALWFVFKGHWRNKLILSVIALASALVLNWLRLAVIVGAVHIIGPRITFEVIHPVLGFFLFALLAVGIVLLVGPFHLEAPTVPPSAQNLIAPGRGRIVSALIIAGLTFAISIPLFSVPRGSFGNPAPLAVYNIHRFLPPLPGTVQHRVYYANESSVLGPHSATQADLYLWNNTTGGQALLEVWSTPSAAALATYGFHACLLYHGDSIAAVKSFQLTPGVVATAYAVNLPPPFVGGPRSTYVDIEWSSAVRAHGRTYNLRWSLAAFPNTAPSEPVLASDLQRTPSMRPLTLLQSMAAPPSQGHWSNVTERVRNNLILIAQELFKQSLLPSQSVKNA